MLFVDKNAICLLIVVAATDWRDHHIWNRDSPWRRKTHVGRPDADLLQYALREIYSILFRV